MKSKLLKTTLILLAILTISLPGYGIIWNKNSYIKEFSSFIAEVKKEYKDYNDKQWEKADKKFDFYSKQKFKQYKDDFTEGDLEIINKLRGKYTAFKLKKESKELLKNIKDGFNQVKGAVEELKDKNDNE